MFVSWWKCYKGTKTSVKKTRVERKPYLENISERLRLAISKSVKLNLTTLLRSMYLMLKKNKITIT